MENGLRLGFIYCSDNHKWACSVSADIYKAAEELGHELLVIGERGNFLVPEKNYINRDFFEYHPYVYKISELIREKGIDLSDQINNEYNYFKKGHPQYKHDIRKIEEKIYLWFAEATIIYKIVQPDVAIVWNGLLGKREIYAKAARFMNIPIFYAEKGLLPNSWYIDSRGINPLSTMADKELNLDISEEEIDKIRQKIKKIDSKGESAWEQPESKDVVTIKKKIGIKENQKVIFFPGQVDSDSNIVLFSNNFDNNISAVQWLAEGINKNEYFILGKPHPKGSLTVRDFNKVIGDKGKAVIGINVLDAIKLADCVVSINSTVAFEAAIRGKPVLLLGQGILNNRDFASNYVVGKDAQIQINECIERYTNDKHKLFNNALSFASYMDSKYYTYRGDLLKTINLIDEISRSIGNRKEKIFTGEEIQVFFSKTTYKDLERWPGGKILFKALFRKIKNKFIQRQSR